MLKSFLILGLSLLTFAPASSSAKRRRIGRIRTHHSHARRKDQIGANRFLAVIGAGPTFRFNMPGFSRMR